MCLNFGQVHGEGMGISEMLGARIMDQETDRGSRYFNAFVYKVFSHDALKIKYISTGHPLFSTLQTMILYFLGSDTISFAR